MIILDHTREGLDFGYTPFITLGDCKQRCWNDHRCTAVDHTAFDLPGDDHIGECFTYYHPVASSSMTGMFDCYRKKTFLDIGDPIPVILRPPVITIYPGFTIDPMPADEDLVFYYTHETTVVATTTIIVNGEVVHHETTGGVVTEPYMEVNPPD